MLDRLPWKLLGPKTAVNKPARDWFNAVTLALTTFGVRFSGATVTPYIERPNPNGGKWGLVLPLVWPLAALAGNIDPRTHENKEIQLVGESTPTLRHTLEKFGDTFDPEPTTTPGADRICLWKDNGAGVDDTLIWPLVSNAIASYLETLTTGGEWPPGTVPPDHAHSAHNDFTDDSHKSSASSDATPNVGDRPSYARVGKRSADAASVMYDRNKIGTEDNYSGNSLHVEKRLHTGGADTLPADDDDGPPGDSDTIHPAGHCQWIDGTRYKLLQFWAVPKGETEQVLYEALARRV